LGNRYDLEKRNTEEYFANTGVVQYFLPDLPAWANNSVAGKCSRSSSIRYFNLKSVRDSYSLNYERALQFQLMYNKFVKAAKYSASVNHINIKEEEKIFSTVADRVGSGIKSFKTPKYKRVNFIWIDHALSNKKTLSRLKKLVKKNDMNLGHPVYVSLCLDSKRLVQFVKDNKIYISNARYFSAELFSPFSSVEKKLLTKVHVNLSDFMQKRQKLYLYTPTGQMPAEIMGNLKIRKY
jgi:hypothetical protein